MSKIEWKTVREFEDITYKKCDGVARIAFNRPNVRNAFRPKTTSELYDAFYDAKGKYSLFYTCNTWANCALKAANQKASLWTVYDKGIFCHYK